jgi:probable DNA metabolism protein
MEKEGGIFHRKDYQPNMFAKSRDIETDESKALAVYDAIEKKISPYDLKRVYKVFMSSAPDKEEKLLDYIRLGFKKGSKIRLLHGHPIVFDVQQIEHKVNREAHRLAGIIRFTVLQGGVLYSPIEPDHDVCEFLAGHFCDRFKHDPFIIHDKKRFKALIGMSGDWYITDFTSENLPDFDPAEKEYRALWKRYFEELAIKERTNPRCQKNFMPVRYWKNLTEMQAELLTL